MRAADVVGYRFGLFTVVERVAGTKKNSRWKCVCDCGREVDVGLPGLKTAESCGCVRNAATAERNRSHGMAASKEHKAWSSAKNRCLNPSYVLWHRYGGRGIRMCDAWAHSFEAFIQDMGRCPVKSYSLDRINGDGHYEPGNCRWASATTQSRNRSNVRVVTVDGESLPVPEWAERLGVSHRMIHARVRICGWSYERAVTTPKRGSRG